MKTSDNENYVARGLTINGIVQGVGFRPFVYQLASRYGLKGEIANTSSGVSLHVEGLQEDIEAFSRDLIDNCPPLARITEISSHPVVMGNYVDFHIAESRGQGSVSTLISPDVAICTDCLRELFDSEDRRFQYPFINCTNCGPRYTIIDNIPYDRPNTSMKHFRMCNSCQAEYDDPGDRRFHAQPNACADCGPHVSLYDNGGERIRTRNAIEQVASFLKEGYVVAIKGLGGFHLAVDAENHEAVCRLRDRKMREEKPFAIMSFDLDRVRSYARLDPWEERLLTAPERPIVILKKKEPNGLSGEISPRNNYYGVMLPYTPLHYLILSHGFTALIMTSGNLSDEPIVIDNDDAFERLTRIADYLLIHDREIYLRSDDSIVRRVFGTTRLIRRSRGYVPTPVFLKKALPKMLACGAELKNTICLTKGDRVFLSQHIGDLENTAAYNFFRMTIRHMQQILDICPEIIAHDLHPDYLSTRYAEEQEGVQKVPVQHHHAHVVSCMAENGLDGPVIGLSFDGTGYGTDGTVWGGEILVAEDSGFTRVASLAPVPMPGSATAIKEPWRMALSYLQDAFGEELWGLDLPLFDEIDEAKVRVILSMILNGINSPQTSSLGRLFDGVAAITGIRDHVFFEGQAAMELEMLARGEAKEPYAYEWTKGELYRIMPQPIVRGVVRDMERGVDPSEISARFHLTLVRMFSEICQVIRDDTGLNRVVMSGGVFQNALLLSGLIRSLEKSNFHVYTHSLIPANDGGICLGQAVIGAATAGA